MSYSSRWNAVVAGSERLAINLFSFPTKSEKNPRPAHSASHRNPGAAALDILVATHLRRGYIEAFLDRPARTVPAAAPRRRNTAMPYASEISRTNPTCFLFLVDQSSSMLEAFGRQPEKKKADGVADAINRLLQNLVLKCAKSGGVRDYFHVGLIGYGGRVGPAFGGPLAGQPLVPVSSLANSPLRVEQRTRKVDDGAGGLVEQSFKFPVWFEAAAVGRTPMCQALALAKQYLEVFLSQFPACYPPLVINVTDGMSTDGDPLPAAKALRDLASADGPALQFNAHVSANQAHPVEFPAAEEGLPDNFAKLLFRMSSVLPPRLAEAARAEGYPAGPGTRGFVFNADLVAVVRFLDLGTRVSQGVR
jgi:hypothetical protein